MDNEPLLLGLWNLMWGQNFNYYMKCCCGSAVPNVAAV